MAKAGQKVRKRQLFLVPRVIKVTKVTESGPWMPLWARVEAVLNVVDIPACE